MRFAELLDGQNKIIVVSAVAPGSSAEKVSNKNMFVISAKGQRAYYARQSFHSSTT